MMISKTKLMFSMFAIFMLMLTPSFASASISDPVVTLKISKNSVLIGDVVTITCDSDDVDMSQYKSTLILHRHNTNLPMPGHTFDLSLDTPGNHQLSCNITALDDKSVKYSSSKVKHFLSVPKTPENLNVKITPNIPVIKTGESITPKCEADVDNLNIWDVYIYVDGKSHYIDEPSMSPPTLVYDKPSAHEIYCEYSPMWNSDIIFTSNVVEFYVDDSLSFQITTLLENMQLAISDLINITDDLEDKISSLESEVSTLKKANNMKFLVEKELTIDGPRFIKSDHGTDINYKCSIKDSWDNYIHELVAMYLERDGIEYPYTTRMEYKSDLISFTVGAPNVAGTYDYVCIAKDSYGHTIRSDILTLEVEQYQGPI